MDRLSSLLFCCAAFVCVCRGEALSSSCGVSVKVKRGTTWRVGPHLNLTVTCPVKHCGESLNVTWCKINSKTCELLPRAENVDVRQDHGEDELVSYLSFSPVSLTDDGLYRCEVRGRRTEAVSHAVNVSVSDLNDGAENFSYEAAEPQIDDNPNPAPASDSWLPYFSICSSILLLVATLTMLTHLCLHGWNCPTWFCKHKREELSTHMIPDAPKMSIPFAPGLQNHLFVLNDIYCSRSAEKTISSFSPPGKQPASAAAAPDGPASDSPVYAVIDVQRNETPNRKQPA